VLLVTLLAACGSPAEPAPTPSTSAVESKRTQTFEAEFEVRQQRLHEVGMELEKRYGWSLYRDRIDFLDASFESELQVASDFRAGSGTLEGFLTMSSPDGDIGLRITGVAAPVEAEESQSFTGEVEVIGGTGAYEALAGRGRFQGQRDNEIDSAVTVQVSLELIDVK
jgi:hypothetical protein